MSEPHEDFVAADAPAAGVRHARAGLVDLLAFFGALALAGGLALLTDRTGQLSARLAFAGATGLVAGCITAWRRLRRLELRRWRSGQAIYHGRRVTVVSAWGVEGQPVPTIEPPAALSTTTPAALSTTTPAALSTTTPATLSTTTPATSTSTRSGVAADVSREQLAG